jgi:arsenical pump membrane protein
LPLVAGLFVMVEGLARTRVIEQLAQMLRADAQSSTAATSWVAGAIAAVTCNLMNNLPVGLIAGSAVAAASMPPQVAGALLIGVDLGPNLSVTGSLATILWLVALRREVKTSALGDFSVWERLSRPLRCSSRWRDS